MEIETVPIGALVEDPANVRLHPKRNLETIKGSLARFGQQKPIVVGQNNVVIAGNGLLAAARELGWTEVQVVRTRLTGADLAAYGLVDNRSGELAEWDFEGLGKLLAGLQEDGIDLKGLGWEDYELQAYLGTVTPEVPTNLDPNLEPDALPKPDFAGADDRLRRFILSYETEDEKAYLCQLLGVAGDQVVYTVGQIREERGECKTATTAAQG